MADNKSTRKRIFIIDGYAMLYRAHFAMIRNPLINSKGVHTSALFGFTNQVLKLLRLEKPDYLIAALILRKKHSVINGIRNTKPPARKCLKK